ncbi:MAG TPA: hypothetical protein VMM18_12345 [Gemmatimonadaceae bacterium]|nr:hypothetical protein [Gemmatimonadaceae bacterium]
MRAIRDALMLGVALALSVGHVRDVGAQDTTFMRALTLEQDGKYREAADAYRSALRGQEVVAALLGLERSYAAMGMTDSILPVLDSLVAIRPREGGIRSVQLRALQMLGRDQALRDAFENWARASPSDPGPYREYTRMLIQAGRVASADSLLRRARTTLGSDRDLAYETAQLRAAAGEWAASSEAWRVALRNMPYLQQAAVYALVRAPEGARADIRRVLAAAPVEPGARRTLAGLEVGWGDPRRGWEALRALPRSDSTVAAWSEFATRSEDAGAWLVARDAWQAVDRVQPTGSIALRASRAALNGGDPASALALAERAAGADSAASARGAVPLMVRALGSLGRPAEAARLAESHGAHLPPALREELARHVAWAWVRAGNLERARSALAAIPGASEGEAAGWMALYDGDLKTARTAMRRSGETTRDAVAALALIMRTKSDTGPRLGEAFLALARGDTIAAATAFADAERELPDAGAILLATAARLHAARADDPRAEPLWRSVAQRYEGTPEAAEADLEWARVLRRRGDVPGAIARLEHLILSYPTSALVPQARRELELARNRIPGTT